MAEEILNALVRIKDLKVAGRTSAFFYKGRNVDLREIGRALGVAHVLEGSVRTQGDKVRITAQLVRSADGFHLLWSPLGRDARRLPQFPDFADTIGLVDVWEKYGPPDLCERVAPREYACR